MFMSDIKTALVTGASRGIGHSIAKKLASEGYHVIGTATTSAGAASIQDALASYPIPGEGKVLDVSQADQIETLLAEISEKGQSPLILVNNAGITKDNLVLRMDDDEWQSVIDTNLTAIFKLTKACLRSMFRARWGRIINISSVVGFTGNSGQANYTAAKAGLVGFSKSLAAEIASRNITVNLVAPGFIETDMTDALPQMIKDELLKKIPMKRMGQPDDIAEAVNFLASEKANYITGETIHVNGGLFMH
ncbi:3-oxoacyl-ACP reductase FabG [Legionella sp. W05-934-2]|uniref:3-oxoacyl-ACP reductase FabG n=1 Tax=Legionella sp. W05-934-2 TaxID=1198649 RepID=UPI0034620FA5